jgi:hypothetical protein
MIGGDTQVRCSVLDHRQHATQHTDDSPERPGPDPRGQNANTAAVLSDGSQSKVSTACRNVEIA